MQWLAGWALSLEGFDIRSKWSGRDAILLRFESMRRTSSQSVMLRVYCSLDKKFSHPTNYPACAIP